MQFGLIIQTRLCGSTDAGDFESLGRSPKRNGERKTAQTTMFQEVDKRG